MARQPNLRENRERKPVDAGVGKPFHPEYYHYSMTQTAQWVIMPFGAYLPCALCLPVVGLWMSAWGVTDTPLFHAQESSGGGLGASWSLGVWRVR